MIKHQLETTIIAGNQFMETILALPNINIQGNFVYKNRSFYQTNYIILKEEQVWFGPRTILETDETFRQLIPYVILKSDDTYLTYTRTKQGGENRLHSKKSIGLGGHISLDDVVIDPLTKLFSFDQTIYKNIARELHEEISWQGKIQDNMKIYGYLYSNETPVDCVHLGIVYIWNMLYPESIKAATPELAHCEFLTLGQLQEQEDQLESWSKILLTHFLQHEQLDLFK